MAEQAIATTQDEAKIQLLRDTCAKDCTANEFALFMYLAKAYKLDPLRHQIWAVKYGNGPASIFTGRDGFLQIAHDSGQFDGMNSGVKTEGEDTIGWAEVYRKDMAHPFRVEVSMREYNTGKRIWAEKPRTMIQKVAESQALRRAFSVSGLYAPEEIDVTHIKYLGLLRDFLDSIEERMVQPDETKL